MLIISSATDVLMKKEIKVVFLQTEAVFSALSDYIVL